MGGATKKGNATGAGVPSRLPTSSTTTLLNKMNEAQAAVAIQKVWIFLFFSVRKSPKKKEERTRQLRATKTTEDRIPCLAN